MVELASESQDSTNRPLSSLDPMRSALIDFSEDLEISEHSVVIFLRFVRSQRKVGWKLTESW